MALTGPRALHPGHYSRTLCRFWKWDGTDWQLIRKKVSIFTNRFEMDCSWLIKGHSSIFEKMYTPKAGNFVLDVGGGLGLELPR